ncbi:centrosomal protein of 83 kDa-like [Lutzomyia longipalpis]|uniref:centrosomal protein of 83 kDa-like n=1 Tax=Lutzomyia longipalpis TaxID=7200 RepID=UPI0024840F96|nr:centrosomal protein of 83 kDa-like [Lutzomyia longipalpis]
MTYQTQRKIYGTMEEVSGRQESVGLMENYDSCAMDAWSGNAIIKMNFLQKILGSGGSSAVSRELMDSAVRRISERHFQETLREVSRTFSGFISDEEPPEEFHQLSGEDFPESSTASISEITREQIIYVDRGDNTEAYQIIGESNVEDFASVIAKLQEEKNALREQLEFAESTAQKYCTYIIDHEAKTYELQQCLNERDVELENFREMQKKLEAMENLIVETQRDQEEFEKNFAKTCESMHVDRMLGSTEKAIKELRRILLPNSVESEGTFAEEEEAENERSPEAVMTDNCLSVEYLNELLCELQEISHASKETSYNFNKLTTDFEITIADLLAIKFDERFFRSVGVDKETQMDTEREQDAREDQEKGSPEKGERSSSSQDHFEEDHVENQRSCSPENKDSEDTKNVLNSSQQLPQTTKLGTTTLFPIDLEKTETEDKATGPDYPLCKSIECQTEALIDQGSSGSAAISKDKHSIWDINLSVRTLKATASVAQEEKELQKMLRKQEKLIDELDREVLVKDNELHELQQNFNHLEEMNKNMKENMAKLDAENAKLKQLLKDLKEKMKEESRKLQESQKLTQKLQESQNLLQELSGAQNFASEHSKIENWNEDLPKAENLPEKLSKSGKLLQDRSKSGNFPEKLPEEENTFQKNLESSTKPRLLNRDTENSSYSVGRSINDSIMESLRHIEESRSLEGSFRTLIKPNRSNAGGNSSEIFEAAGSSLKAPLPSQKDSTHVGIIGKRSENVKKKSIERKKEVKKPPKIPINLHQTFPKASTSAPKGKEIVKMELDLLASGDSTPVGSSEDPENPYLKAIAGKIIKTGFNSLSSDELCCLHYYIVTVEMKRKSEMRGTAIQIRSTEIYCSSGSSNNCSRIDSLLKRLQVCKQKAQDLQEKLLYASLEKILMRNE